MSLHWRSPLIFAHRGASAQAPENTLSAFELAVQSGADVIELDAKLSADEHVVIIHDHTVDRTTDGTGNVSNLPLAALQKLNASINFPESSNKEHIPTLEEVIESLRGKTLIDIELSNYKSPFDALPAKVAQIILHFGIHEHVLVSSFHPIPLKKFHQLLPSIPIGFLAKRGFQGSLSRSKLGRLIVPHQALHPEKSDISPNLVLASHQSGLRVHTYTVNEPDEITRLFKLGVDGIITDNPLLTRRILESFTKLES